MFTRTFRLVALAATVLAGLAAGRGAEAAPLSTYNLVLGNGGAATAYFIGASADDTNLLSVVGGPTDFFNNKTTLAQTSQAIGVFGPGQEIELVLTNVTAGDTFYTGSGLRNSDGNVHADVVSDPAAIPGFGGLSAASQAYAMSLMAANVTFVGFEDLPGSQSDFDYNDLVLAIISDMPLTSGISSITGDPSTIPEPGSLALLGLGLAGLGLFRRRL